MKVSCNQEDHIRHQYHHASVPMLEGDGHGDDRRGRGEEEELPYDGIPWTPRQPQAAGQRLRTRIGDGVMHGQKRVTTTKLVPHFKSWDLKFLSCQQFSTFK